MSLDRKSLSVIGAVFLIITLFSAYMIFSNIFKFSEQNGRNTPPTDPIIIISPSPSYNEDRLRCSILLPSTDIDNDSITYSYKWVRNGSVTNIELETVSATETSIGDIWQCFVTPFDGQDYGDPGSDTTVIQERFQGLVNTPPTAPEVSLTPDPAYSNDTITCTILVPSFDLENDSISYHYEWFKNKSVTGFTGRNLSAIHTKSGEEWKCVVTPFDGTDYGSSGNALILIQDDGIPLPENSLPTRPEVTIVPDFAYTHDNLTCIVITPSIDADNDSIAYIYEWFQNGDLTNETGATILSNRTGVGEEWKCVVTPFDGIEYGNSGNDSLIIQVNASGTYSLSPIINYYCAYGIVNLYYTSFTFVDTGTTLTVQPMINGGGYMTGSTASNGVIDVTFVYFGGCDEIYSLIGTFIDEDTWQATFIASYSGMCFDCSYVSWIVTGTRV